MKKHAEHTEVQRINAKTKQEDRLSKETDWCGTIKPPWYKETDSTGVEGEAKGKVGAGKEILHKTD